MTGWSQLEAEATVADYLAMLGCELRGEPYSKAEHRRALARLLDHRSDAAIERKHQNISAILLGLGLPCIDGYKPLGNYQRLLEAVMVSRLQASPDLLGMLGRSVAEDASAPPLDAILAALVQPPGPAAPGRAAQASRERTFPNYLELEAQNRSLGAAGEEFVLRFEQARLMAARRERLAAKVEHVSRSRGDGAGFDILSFETSGEERLVEVKTTAFGAYTPFYLTRNELAVSRTQRDRYFLYRAFQFRAQPKLYYLRGALDHSFAIEPTQWMASIMAAHANAAGSAR